MVTELTLSNADPSIVSKVPAEPDFGEKELMTGACAFASVK